MLDEAVAISQEWGLMLINGVSRVSLATANMHLGRNAEAARILSDLISDWHFRGNWHNQWVALRNVVELLAAAGDVVTAVRLHRAIEASPSSPDVFGVQKQRLATLAAGWQLLPVEVLSDDQVVTTAIEALDAVARSS